MTLENFQKAYGVRFQRLLESIEFKAAIMLIRTQRKNYLLGLTDEQIDANPDRILNRVIESVRFENDLLTLNSKREFKIAEDIPLEYVSPEEEAAAWATIDNLRQQGKRKKAA